MTAITHTTQPSMPLAQPGDFTQDQVQLIKQTVAAGTTDLELALFLEVARSSGLNPFQRQIYAVMRSSRVQVNGRWENQNKMVIQTGIDGYRLIAARSGVHLGTTDPEFGPVSKDGFPEFARVIVRKLVHGQVAEFPATARWSEYVQMGKDGVTSMWKRMPHTMLGKCAEALALRKAFPAELSGVYSDVEMAQADNTQPAQPVQETKLAPAGPDEMEARMKAYGPKLAARREAIKKYGVTDKQVTDFLTDLPDWRASDENAERAVSKLTEWGKGLKAAQVSEPETADVVDAELRPESPENAPLNRGQEQALVMIAKGAGAGTSEARAALWAYMLNATAPVPTKHLTGEQAAFLIDTFQGLSPEERQQANDEAGRAMKGALL